MSGGSKRAVVLAVDEQQIDADGGRRLLQHVAERDEAARRRTRRRSRRGSAAPRLPRIGILVRRRARVPVRDVEDALRRLRAEAREDVAQRQRVAARRHVRPALLDDGVGARRIIAHDPVAGARAPARARHARAEGELLARVRERRIADEGGLRALRKQIARGHRGQSGERGESDQGERKRSSAQHRVGHEVREWTAAATSRRRRTGPARSPVASVAG